MEIYNEENLNDIKNIGQRFRTNYKNFWQEHHYYVTLLIIAAVVDCFSTIHFMHIIGPEKEIHPMIRELSFLLGPLHGPILGKMLQVSIGMIAIIYIKKYSILLIVITAIMYSWAATANFIAFM